MNLVGRKVSLVRMHTSTHVQGIKSLGPVLTKDSAGTLGRLELTVCDHGILVKMGKVEAVIAVGNIISYELEPLVEAVKTAPVNGTNNSQGSDSSK